MTRESLELLGIAKSAVPIFLNMLESAVAYYGEDRVDIQKDPADSNYIRIMVHFPKIEVTNSLQMRHEVKDIYAFIIVDKRNGKLRGYRYSKSTFTFAEASIGYIQSHGQRTTLIKNGVFNINAIQTLRVGTGVCTGSSPLADSIKVLTDDEYLPAIFMKLLVDMDMTIRWESVEGGPFVKMKELLNMSTFTKNKESESCLASFRNSDAPFTIETYYTKKSLFQKSIDTFPLLSYLANLLIQKELIKVSHSLSSCGLPTVLITNSEEDLGNILLKEFHNLPHHIQQFYNMLLVWVNNDEYIYKIQFKVLNPIFGKSDSELFTFKGKSVKLIITPPSKITESRMAESIKEKVMFHPQAMKLIIELIKQAYIFSN